MGFLKDVLIGGTKVILAPIYIPYVVTKDIINILDGNATPIILDSEDTENPDDRETNNYEEQ